MAGCIAWVVASHGWLHHMADCITWLIACPTRPPPQPNNQPLLLLPPFIFLPLSPSLASPAPRLDPATRTFLTNAASSSRRQFP